MPLTGETYALATSLIFLIAGVFSMLGLGGGMLYVPVFKWLGRAGYLRGDRARDYLQRLGR